MRFDFYDFRLIGLQIRICREARNISQEQLANQAGLSTGTIGKIERGINNPKTETLLRIAHELDVPCKLFFEQIDNQRPAASMQTQRLLKYVSHLDDTEINALCLFAQILMDRHLDRPR